MLENMYYAGINSLFLEKIQGQRYVIQVFAALPQTTIQHEGWGTGGYITFLINDVVRRILCWNI